MQISAGSTVCECLQGMYSLLASGQVHEVLAEGSMLDKSLMKMSTCGGLSLFQLSSHLEAAIARFMPTTRVRS